MFRDLVNKPIDPIPLEYIQSLVRVNNEPDYSLTCLGIAMLKHRIEGYNGISGIYYSLSSKGACISDFVERYKRLDEHPTFCFYKYTNDNFDQNVIDENLAEFKEKKSISAFVKEKTGSECTVLYHETKNVVGIFVNSIDNRLYHLLLSFISLYFPSLFKENPLTENDYSLIKSLSKKDKNDFYACIKNMVQPYAMEFRRIQMKSFMKGLHEKKIADADRAVANQRRRVQEHENLYTEAIRTLRELIVQFEGLKVTENYDSPEEDLVEYLATNKDIHNLVIRDNRMFFSVTTLLSNFNVDAWNTFKERGYIFDGEYDTRLTSEAFRNIENRKLLLNSIFADSPDLFVRMAGNYQLDIGANRIYTDSDYRYLDDDPMFKDYLPNPHLKIFGCLGGYKDKVIRALADRNYVAAVNLCIASAGSINLDETTQTFRPFLGWLLNSKDKVIVTRDGTEMTPEEALLWLADREKKDE